MLLYLSNSRETLCIYGLNPTSKKYKCKKFGKSKFLYVKCYNFEYFTTKYSFEAFKNQDFRQPTLNGVHGYCPYIKNEWGTAWLSG